MTLTVVAWRYARTPIAILARFGSRRHGGTQRYLTRRPGAFKDR
jgi:hypothetical protein